MVSIQSSYTVTPFEPTPTEKLFSLCEQIKLRTHAPLLYVYKSQHHDNDPNTSSSSSSSPSPSSPSPSSTTTFNLALQTLKDSLSKALSIYYPLAGRLSWIEGSRWELHCNAKGAMLLEASCKEVCLDDLGDFVPTHLVSQLIPNIDYYGSPIEDVPLLAVQVTGFRCGGFTIGVALCRASIDGTATMRFMNTWAKLARGDPLDSKEDFPNHDRTLLDSRRLNDHSGSLHHRHSEFCNPPPWLGKLEGDTRVVVSVVKLTREQVKRLRMKAMMINNDSLDPVRPYSTFEVITGHLWRCVSKARYEGNVDQPTRLSTLVNCRNRLRPPLPAGYAGNAAFPTVTPTCSFGDLMHKPLSFAAGKVKGAIERVDDGYVRSSLDHIASVKDMDLVRYNFHYPAKSVHEGPYKGNPNLFVVSWMNFSYKDADFGWGEPVYFGPGYMDSEGKAFIMNKANGDGLIVAICLESWHMDAFKKFFYEDTEEVFPTSKL